MGIRLASVMCPLHPDFPRPMLLHLTDETPLQPDEHVLPFDFQSVLAPIIRVAIFFPLQNPFLKSRECSEAIFFIILARVPIIN